MMFRPGIWSFSTLLSTSCRSASATSTSSSTSPSTPYLLATLFQGCANSPQQDSCHQYNENNNKMPEINPKVHDKLASFKSFGKWSWKNSSVWTGYHNHNNQEKKHSFNLQKRLYHHQKNQKNQLCLSNSMANHHYNDHCQLTCSFISTRLYSSSKSTDDKGPKDCSEEAQKTPAENSPPPPPPSSLESESQSVLVTIKDGLSTRDSAADFLGQLSDHQRQLIYHTLNIDILRDKYEGTLGSSRLESHSFLSRFGRPATAKEDPTGTLCEISPKWLHARLDEKSPPASAAAIWAVVVKNALPFIGFGFLDNLIMILAGDYIDLTIGAALGISTMAAAALGNTISDVAGIGSAWYVEAMASKIGIKDPDLTPSQMASGSVRWACNLGRALGVTIGCLLGMFPLLFLPNAGIVKEKAKQADDGADAEKSKEDKSKFA
ncbi:unnamed protein product [Orchesella dallaii]|uniref:Transmembrane protein 65 n=1 Tax=Orchesella dallaii TaxID=48710 RepID=A0ABP1RQ91_9HEXA